MRLYNVITLRLTFLSFIILVFWSVCFYYAVIQEVNDEVDDSLEDYAETLVIRAVRNEPLPDQSIGSNNQFFIRPVTSEYAAVTEHIRYRDKDVYIDEKNEFEPARVLTYIFQNDEGNFYELEVSTPHIDKSDLKEAIFYCIIFLFITILLSITLLNLWTIRRSMRPLRSLLKWLDNYEVSKGQEPLNNPTKIYEYKVLNDVIQSSLKRTEEAYNQQKMFIGNASHEMQTPLAICSNRLEMLLSDNTLSENQQQEILKTKQTLEQLSQMNRSLLLLYKIENKQFTNSDKVCLNELISQFLPDYKMVYEAKNITTEFLINGDFIVEMDDSLAHTLVSNLLKNAFIHNTDNGKLVIEIDADCISIKNSGMQKPLDENLIFERFYHTPENQHSTGLGLSIAKAICQIYNLNIGYSYSKGFHTFTVKK